eukprot:1271449-Lingulodinium_polyedra.AAC.1
MQLLQRRGLDHAVQDAVLRDTLAARDASAPTDYGVAQARQAMETAEERVARNLGHVQRARDSLAAVL